MSQPAASPLQNSRAKSKAASLPYRCLCVTAMLLGLFAAAQAETATWSGSASDGNWNTGGAGGNWTNLTAPGVSGSAGGNQDVAIFQSAGTTVTDSIANRALGEIEFNNTGSLGNFTIGSGTNTIYFFDYNSSSISNILETGTATSGISENIASNIMMTGASGNTANDLRIGTANGFSGTLTISGNISTVATSGTSGLRIVPSGSTSGAQPNNITIFSGVISDGALAKVGISRVRDGVVDFTGANTYSGGYVQGTTGGTADDAGAVTEIGVNSVGSVGSIASSAFGVGTVTFNGGDVMSDGTTARTIYNNIIFSELGNESANETYSANFGSATNTGLLTFAGTVNLNGDGSTGTPATTITTFSSTILSGVLFGSGTTGLIKAGSGMLTLSGSNTYTGPTTVSAGILNYQNGTAFGANSAITVSPGATAQLQGGFTSTGTDSVTISGVGASGATGVLENVSGNNSASTPIILTASSTISSDAGSLTLSGGVTGAHNLALQSQSSGNGAITLSGGNINTGNAISNTGAGTGTVTISAAIVSGTVTENSAGSMLVLSGSNTNTGVTSVSSGILNIQNGSDIGGSSTISEASGATIQLQGGISGTGANTVTIQGSGAAGATGALENVSGNNSINADIILANGPTFITSDSGLLTLSGTITGGHSFDLQSESSGNGSITLSAGSINTGQGLTNNGAGTGTVTISSNIVSVATFIENSAGSMLVLTGSNAFTAATTLTAGIINYQNGASFGTNSAITEASGGTVQLQGGITSTGVKNVTLSGSGAAGATGALENVSGNNSATTPIILAGSSIISSDAGSLTLSGGVTGANSLTLQSQSSGNGTITLSGATVNNGGAITNNGAGTGATSITSNIGSSVTGLTQNSSGTLILSGSNSYTGGTTISSGTLQAGNTYALGGTAGAVTVNGGTLDLHGFNPTVGALDGASGGLITTEVAGLSTLTSNSGTSGTYAGVIADGSGQLALTKAGSGTEILSGADPYTGATTVNAGTLQIGNGSAGSISSGTSISVSAGTLAFDEATGSTVSNNISDAGTVSGVEGSGIINTLTGNIAGTGAVSVTGAGTLILGGSNTYTGATTVSAGTLQFDGFTAMSGSSALAISGTTGVIQLRSDSSATFIPSGISASGNTAIGIDVNSLTGATNNTLTLSGVMNFGINTSNTINVTSGNGYSLSLGNISVSSNSGSDTTNLLAINAISANVSVGAIQIGSFGEGVSFGGSGSITVNNFNLNSNSTSLITVGNGSNTPTVTIVSALTTSNRTQGAGGFATVVNNGATLNVDAADALNDLGGSGNATLTLNPGGDLNLNITGALGGSQSVNLVINGGTINNTSATANTSPGLNTLQDTGDFAWGGTDALSISTSFALGGTTSTLRTITTSGTAVLTLSGNISTSGSITSLAVVGPGVLTLAGANTISGGVTLNGGQLNVNNATALGSSGTFTITSGTLGNTSGGTITTGNAQSWNGSFAVVGPNNLSAGTGAITLGTSLTVTVASSTFTVNGGINGAGDSLTAAGTGILALGGSNTYTGGATLSSGQLSINNNNALGTGAFTITTGTIDNTSGSSVTLANNLDVNGNFTWKGSNALVVSGSTALSGATTTITTAGSSALSLTGIVSGTSQLGVAGTGKVYVNAANTYSGGTVVNGGNLGVGNSANTGTSQNTSSLGSGTVTVNSGGIVSLGNIGSTANSFTFANAFTLNGGTVSGYDGINHISGGLNVTGTGSNLSSTFNDSGKGFYIDGIVSGTGDLTLEYSALDGVGTNSYDGSTIHFTNAGSASVNTYSGTITVTPATSGHGNGGSYLEIDGSNVLANATVNLSGNNSGTTDVHGAGTLLFGSGNDNVTIGALSGGGNAVLADQSSGAVALTAGGNNSSTTYSGVLSGAGSLTKTGTGGMILSGSNTYSGGTTVSAGALIVSGSISGTAAVNNNATLGGDGVIGGAVTVHTGGTLAPGLGETTLAGATLTLRSGLTLSGTSALAINLDNSDDIDSLTITGNLSIGANDTLTLNLINGASLSQSSSYVIATYTGTLTGTFAITNLPAGYEVNYGVAEPDTIEIVAVAVPEPGAFGTMLAGLGMLLGIQRWRKTRVGT